MSEGAVESKGAISFIDVADVEFRLDPLTAEGNLMLTPGPVDVVGYGERVGVEVSRRACAAVDGPSPGAAGYRRLHAFRRQVVQGDADGA